MSYTVRGDYFEACSCDVSCPCIFLAPATHDHCEAVIGWHISEGSRDGVDLAGLNVALVAKTSKQMTDGNWTVALYLDERATADQGNALGAIFSGQAGGHLGNLAPLIGTVAAVERAPVEFTKSNGSRSLRVGDLIEADLATVKGMDGNNPPVITNPMFGAVMQPLTQARASRVAYSGAWKFEAAESNSFIADFQYQGDK